MDYQSLNIDRRYVYNQFVTDVTSESPENATDLNNETTTEPGTTTPRPTRDLITPFLQVSHML